MSREAKTRDSWLRLSGSLSGRSGDIRYSLTSPKLVKIHKSLARLARSYARAFSRGKTRGDYTRDEIYGDGEVETSRCSRPDPAPVDLAGPRARAKATRRIYNRTRFVRHVKCSAYNLVLASFRRVLSMIF